MAVKTKREEFERYMNKIVVPILEAQTEVYGPLDYSFLTTLIDGNHVKRALDVGTGEGSFILELARRTPGVKYHAIDASAELIDCAQEKTQNENEHVSFDCSLFDKTFSHDDFDMILARFSLEHAGDIDGFISAVFQKLKSSGHFAIIEYYVDDGSVDDPVWKEFRKREKDLYGKLEAHSRLGMALPGLLSCHGFKNIKSSFLQISPSTVGAEPFYNLVRVSGQVYAALDPEDWPVTYLEKLNKWCDEMLESKDVDPMLFLTHTVGQKFDDPTGSMSYDGIVSARRPRNDKK